MLRTLYIETVDVLWVQGEGSGVAAVRILVEEWCAADEDAVVVLA